MMKTLIRKLFSLLLTPLESGDEAFHFKPINRTVLLAFGVIFSALGGLVIYLIPVDSDVGYFIPAVVFIGAGTIALVVSLVGSDRAVSKIWGNK